MSACTCYRTFLKTFFKKSKLKHNLIILIIEAANVPFPMFSRLCAFAPWHFLPEILLATYHMSKSCQSFKTQVKHLLLHHIFPKASSQSLFSFLNHSTNTLRYFPLPSTPLCTCLILTGEKILQRHTTGVHIIVYTPVHT